ncbi:MAG: hypothetical protein ACRDM2_07105 [Gaiellaceae bacterium]
MLGAKVFAAAFTAVLLIPAANATPGMENGSGNGHGRPASVGVGSGEKAKPPQAQRGQAKKAENAVRKAERRAAREAAREDAPAGPMRSNPARTCKSEREEMGDDAFVDEYGVNENGANAFGKCVSKEARERDGAGSGDEGESLEPDDPTVIGSAREASAFTEALAFVRMVVKSMRELL